jgi:hypothetical protein
MVIVIVMLVAVVEVAVMVVMMVVVVVIMVIGVVEVVVGVFSCYSPNDYRRGGGGGGSGGHRHDCGRVGMSWLWSGWYVMVVVVNMMLVVVNSGRCGGIKAVVVLTYLFDILVLLTICRSSYTSF